jgi:regulator of protease activity HflC (stomatin/prohibitin superfamily)
MNEKRVFCAFRARTVVVSCLLVAGLGGCATEVPPAHVGIKFNANSGISEKLEKPQVVWCLPGDRVLNYPTSIKNATFVKNAHEGERNEDDSIRCSTVEGAILPVDVTVAYHVQAAEVLTAFQNFGSDDITIVQKAYMRWVTTYGLNAVSGQRSIFDILSTDRAGFGGQAKQIIAPIMAAWGVTIDDVYIGEVYPPEDIRNKVQERIAARNELELAKIRLQKAKIDAHTILTKAKQDAETNQLLSQQGDTAIKLKRLELRNDAIKKWDGRPPMVGSGAVVPFTSVQIR